MVSIWKGAKQPTKIFFVPLVCEVSLHLTCSHPLVHHSLLDSFTDNKTDKTAVGFGFVLVLDQAFFTYFEERKKGKQKDKNWLPMG